MNKIILLLFTSVFCCEHTFSQQFFNKNYSGQNWTYSGNSIIVLNDKSIIISSNYAVVKTDSTGVFQWAKSYGYNHKKVLRINDNNIFIAGNYNYDVALTKIDLNGNLIWTKIFNFSDSTDTDFFVDAVVNRNGTLTLGLDVYYYPQSSTLDSSKIVLFNVDTFGNIQWSKSYFDPLYVSSDLNSLTIGHDNNYLISGSINGIGSGGNDALILKIDSDGVLLKSMAFGTSTDDRSYFILPDDDKIVVSSFNDYGINPSFSIPFLFCLDSNYNVEWCNLYDWTCNNMIFNANIISKVNGNYFINNGTNVSIIDTSGQIIMRKAMNSSGLAGFFWSYYKVDSTVYYVGGGYPPFNFLTIAKGDTNEFFGCSYTQGPLPCVSNLSITKTDFSCSSDSINGIVDTIIYIHSWPAPIEFIQCSSPLSIDNLEIKNDSSLIYPNPNHGIIRLSKRLLDYKQVSFTLKDITGKLIYHAIIKNEEPINLQDLHLNGLYIASIEDEQYSWNFKTIFIP